MAMLSLSMSITSTYQRKIPSTGFTEDTEASTATALDTDSHTHTDTDSATEDTSTATTDLTTVTVSVTDTQLTTGNQKARFYAGFFINMQN